MTWICCIHSQRWSTQGGTLHERCTNSAAWCSVFGVCVLHLVVSKKSCSSSSVWRKRNFSELHLSHNGCTHVNRLSQFRLCHWSNILPRFVSFIYYCFPGACWSVSTIALITHLAVTAHTTEIFIKQLLLCIYFKKIYIVLNARCRMHNAIAEVCLECFAVCRATAKSEFVRLVRTSLLNGSARCTCCGCF